MYKAIICWFCWNDENKVSPVVATYIDGDEKTIHICEEHKEKFSGYDFSDNDWSPIFVEVEIDETVEEDW